MPKQKRLAYVTKWLERNKNNPKWKDKAKPDKVAAAHRYADRMVSKSSKKTKSKKATRQARGDRAGGYVTTRGQRTRQLDRAADYTLE